MKKWITLTLLSLMTMNIANAAEYSIVWGKKPVDKSLKGSIEVVNILNITESMLNEFMEGKTPLVAIECPQGTFIPANLFLTGSIVSLDTKEDNSFVLKAEKTFYIRRDKKQFLFSFDCTTWKNFAESFTGNATIGLEVKSDRPVVTIGADLTSRE